MKYFPPPPAHEERLTPSFDVSSLFYWILSSSKHIVRKNLSTHNIPHATTSSGVHNKIYVPLEDTDDEGIHSSRVQDLVYPSFKRTVHFYIYWNCSAMWKIFRQGINFLWCYLRLARWLVRTTRPCPHVISMAQSRSHYPKGHIWSYGQVSCFIWIHELQIKSQKPELSNGLAISFKFRCPSSHVTQRWTEGSREFIQTHASQSASAVAW